MEEQEEETRVHQNKRLVQQTAFTTLGLIDDCDFVITFVVSFDRDSKVVTEYSITFQQWRFSIYSGP